MNCAFTSDALKMLLERLSKAVTDEELTLALYALGNTGHPSIAAPVRAVMDNEAVSDQVRLVAFETLQRIVGDDAIQASVRGPLSQGPIFQTKEEVQLIGNEEFGAKAGYELVMYNPLSPFGDENLIAKASGYGTAFAFKRKFQVVQGTVGLSGGVKRGGGTNPTEAWFYYSVGGVILTDCIDLIGQACVSRRPPTLSSIEPQYVSIPVVLLTVGLSAARRNAPF
jgi:hypothetical protein